MKGGAFEERKGNGSGPNGNYMATYCTEKCWELVQEEVEE